MSVYIVDKETASLGINPDLSVFSIVPGSGTEVMDLTIGSTYKVP